MGLIARNPATKDQDPAGADDIILERAAATGHELLALHIQLTHPTLGTFQLAVGRPARRTALQRLGEQEVFEAVGFFELTLTLLRDLIQLAHFGFDLGQGVAGLCALLVFDDEALFKLGTDRIARHPLRAGLARHACRRRSWSWNGRRRAD